MGERGFEVENFRMGLFVQRALTPALSRREREKCSVHFDGAQCRQLPTLNV
jgi:hypothetical protein